MPLDAGLPRRPEGACRQENEEAQTSYRAAPPKTFSFSNVSIGRDR
jgi:hypothetical protein